MAVIHPVHRVQDILTSLIHVVFGANADGFDVLLRPYHMLQRMSELISQLAMRDKHKSDHNEITPRYNDTLGLVSHCNRPNGGGKPSCRCKVEVQAKNSSVAIMKKVVPL